MRASPSAGDATAPPHDELTRSASTSPERKKPLTVIMIAAICVVALAAAAAYFFTNRQVTVPDLRGDTVALATSKLQGSHLKAGQTTVRQDSTVDPTSFSANILRRTNA